MTNISEYKPLKNAIIRLHKKYVKEQIKADQGETDIEKTYAEQRKHLEKSVGNERKVIAKNADNFRKANEKMMKENVELLVMINDLRKDVVRLKIQERSRRAAAGMNTTMGSKFSERGGVHPATMKELQMQDNELERLQQRYQELSNQAQMQEA